MLEGIARVDAASCVLTRRCAGCTPAVLPPRLDLRSADVVVVVEDLSLQVAEVDDVVVDEADGADARQRQVERHRRAEPAGADDQHPGCHELALADAADLAA